MFKNRVLIPENGLGTAYIICIIRKDRIVSMTQVRDTRNNKVYTFVRIEEHEVDGRSYASRHIDHVPHVKALTKNNCAVHIPLNYAEFMDD